MHRGILEHVRQYWDQSIQPALMDFIRIPALSPDFDKHWEQNGKLSEALEQAKAWAERQGIAGLTCAVIQHPGYTPCLRVEIAANTATPHNKSVFFYGHLDKQPPNEGWDPDKSAWEPVIQEGRLYGRGAVDDGYAFYTALGAVKVLQDLGLEHPRCVGLFETCEESASKHYEEYLQQEAEHLGEIGLVIALDSAGGDYKRLWVTHSLRGMLGGVLKVQTLTSGVHSGEASGIVPSSFMILRQLLDRIEDSRTGEVFPDAFRTKLSDKAVEENRAVARLLGDGVWTHYPWAACTEPLSKDPLVSLLNRNWRPELTVTGMDGIPAVENAGNVMRVFTAAKIGLRLPPDVDARVASKALQRILTENPPFSAELTYTSVVESDGWVAPEQAPWLTQTFVEASQALWGEDPCYLGMGGSIPLMNVFSRTWPKAQYMVAGALGPNSNAHGPNESLDIDYAQKLMTAVAMVVHRYED